MFISIHLFEHLCYAHLGKLKISNYKIPTYFLFSYTLVTMRKTLLALLVVLATFSTTRASLEHGPWSTGIIQFARMIFRTNGTNEINETNTAVRSTRVHQDQNFIEIIANAKWYQNVSNILKQMIEDRQDDQSGFWSIFSRILYFGRMSTS